jgi:ATP-binding cassette subfamily C (CFTR/MRP) protein 2
MSIMDLDIPFSLTFAVGGTIVFYSSLTVLAVVTWQVLIVAIPMVYVAIRMQVMNFKLYCSGEIVFTLF